MSFRSHTMSVLRSSLSTPSLSLSTNPDATCSSEGTFDTHRKEANVVSKSTAPESDCQVFSLKRRSINNNDSPGVSPARFTVADTCEVHSLSRLYLSAGVRTRNASIALRLACMADDFERTEFAVAKERILNANNQNTFAPWTALLVFCSQLANHQFW